MPVTLLACVLVAGLTALGIAFTALVVLLDGAAFLGGPQPGEPTGLQTWWPALLFWAVPAAGLFALFRRPLLAALLSATAACPLVWLAVDYSLTPAIAFVLPAASVLAFVRYRLMDRA